MATHSSFIAWRIPGMGEPGGLSSMGSHRVRHDWSDLAAATYVRLYVNCISLKIKFKSQTLDVILKIKLNFKNLPMKTIRIKTYGLLGFIPEFNTRTLEIFFLNFNTFGITWISHGCICVPHPEAPIHLPLPPTSFPIPSHKLGNSLT